MAPHRHGHERGLSCGETRAHVRGQRGDAVTLRPAQFDVLLSSNMFGDILSDARGAGRLNWADSIGKFWVVRGRF